MKIGKYAFNSREQAKEKIKALGFGIDEDGNEYPTHNHSVVELGYIMLKEGVYDDDLKEIEPPILSDKCHVDVMWVGLEDHPYGWATYAVDLSSNGVHSFLGVNYIENKM